MNWSTFPHADSPSRALFGLWGVAEQGFDHSIDTESLPVEHMDVAIYKYETYAKCSQQHQVNKQSYGTSQTPSQTTT